MHHATITKAKTRQLELAKGSLICLMVEAFYSSFICGLVSGGVAGEAMAVGPRGV